MLNNSWAGVSFEFDSNKINLFQEAPAWNSEMNALNWFITFGFAQNEKAVFLGMRVLFLLNIANQLHI